MKKQKKILLSFIGSNDAGKLSDKPDGAILTALTNEIIDEVHLLWNKGTIQKISYENIADYLKSEIIKRKLANKASTYEFVITDVTDHNQIYLHLKEFTDTLPKNKSYSYTAAISSGTPAMQVCWILLAESGDFSDTNPLQLIKIKDPQFGESSNIPVKIDTALPQIIRLRDEVDKLKSLIPVATIQISKPSLLIGDVEIPLTPIELSYYRYFSQRVRDGLEPEKFDRITSFKFFTEITLNYHEEFFPALDTYREERKRSMKKNVYTDLGTFRANVTKTNNKIREHLIDNTISEQFIISAQGRQGARTYGIKAPMNKIKIVK